VRHDLDGRAEVIPAPLLGKNLLVDAARGDVVVTARRAASEAFVVPKVEVGFRPVVGHEYFAMLVGRHRAGIDIEIRVELAQPYLIAARLQQCAKRRRSKTLAKGGDHTAGDEDVPRHGA